MYPLLTVYCVVVLYLRFDQCKVSPGQLLTSLASFWPPTLQASASGLDSTKLPGDPLLDLGPPEHLVSLQ